MKQKLPVLRALSKEVASYREMAGAITVDSLLADKSLPEAVRVWLEAYKTNGQEWAKANNPPGFVTNEGCWEKAKRAATASGASDFYAFAVWWYQEHCG